MLLNILTRYIYCLELTFADDSVEVNPRKICNECYCSIMDSHLSGKQGQHCYGMNLDGAYGQLKDKVKDIQDIWKPHAESGCSVYELYTVSKTPKASP